MSTSTSISTSEARKAEMARLFDLFEKLKSRRARPTSMINEDAPMEDVRPTPALTLAEVDPAMKLSNIVDRSSTSTRPRRNTVASIIAAQGGTNDMPVEDNRHSEDDAGSLKKFPQAEEKGFAFTFKHMVHKLYEKEDWARAVKEELEKSQSEFKPLSEQTNAPEKKKMEELEEKENDGVIRFKMATSPGVGKRGSVGGRQRSLSIAAAGGHKGYTPLSPGIRSPTIKSPSIRSPGVEGKPDLRALKKRCVGRRKSDSGPLNAEANKASGGNARGTWVYNSAVSASERPVATTFATFPPAPPPSSTRKAPSSLKYQPLGMKNLSSTMKEGAGCSGLKRRVSTGGEAAATAPLVMPLQYVTNTNATGLVARRRAMKAIKMNDQNEEEKKPKGALVA